MIAVGFLKSWWGRGTHSPPPPPRPHPPLPEELLEIRLEYNRRLRELDNAIHALLGDEPDRHPERRPDRGSESSEHQHP